MLFVSSGFQYGLDGKFYNNIIVYMFHNHYDMGYVQSTQKIKIKIMIIKTDSLDKYLDEQKGEEK